MRLTKSVNANFKNKLVFFICKVMGPGSFFKFFPNFFFILVFALFT